ncbi:prepilin peptidase [Adlercreutzia faecimuris]|uniref:A24 family peptidase n=1 Tax=Adlercreutzia faecimuris TaxID=2897341 RepID=A0ABS9WDC0_9ACTN|nr:A24 family peptidase [Adlercreutzia sp. JBNU-10]MCI2240867.1 A24 family peptidase [Adlercreutzia sp. JBNU-10]
MIVTLLAYGSFMLLLVVAAGDDLRELRIPNGIVAALAAVWIVWRIALAATHPEGALVPALSVADGLLGALVLGGGLLAVTLAFEALAGRRAMGGGDVKLMAAVGLFLGIEGGLVCLLTACLISLLLALLLPRLGWAPRPAPAAPTPAIPAPAAPAPTPAAPAPVAPAPASSASAPSVPASPAPEVLAPAIPTPAAPTPASPAPAPAIPASPIPAAPTPAGPTPTARASASRPDSSFDGRETDVSRETYPHPVSDASHPAGGAPSSERNALGAVPFGPGIAVGAGMALLSMVFL